MKTKQTLIKQRIPFELKHEANKETLQAIKEIKTIKKDTSVCKKYQSATEMMEDILG